MSPEYLAGTVLPYIVWFAIAIGFLASITIGVSMGMSLLYLHAMMSSLKKFNANMDEAHAAFEKLQASTQQQLLSQVRMSEAWHRQRTEQLKEEEAETQENGRAYPSFTQDWRANRQG